MSTLTPKEVQTFARLAGKVAGKPMQLSIAQMAEQYVGAAVGMLATLAKGCPVPDIRYKAATALIDIARGAETERADYFAGNVEALEQSANLPHGRQREAALQLFAQGQIGRKDLDTVLKIIKADNRAKIDALLAHNERLTKQIVDQQAVGSRQIDAAPNPYADTSPLANIGWVEPR